MNTRPGKPRRSQAAMLPEERRSAAVLAAVYALRMLGMFLMLPVLALYVNSMGVGDKALIGLAMGAYGLTQAVLQLPLGMASDYYGRKRVIYLGLAVFALGSFMAAWSPDIHWLIAARAIQGAGAVSAAVTALLADLTREEVRTRAMAVIGLSIGLTFSVSLVIGPMLGKWIGVPGIFVLTGVLTLLAMATVRFFVPDPVRLTTHADTGLNTGALPSVLKNTQLLRLNFGIFALHAAQMALFTSLPFALVHLGLPKEHHWYLYLPVAIIGFVLMVPAIIVGETRNQLKPVFVGAIALMLLAQLGLAVELGTLKGIFASMVLYFIGFNILEATLPSLVSKIAPAQTKGTAIGVYNTCQSFGLFAGGAAGGVTFQHFGFQGVFVLCTVLMLVWLVVAATAPKPLPVRTLMFGVPAAFQGASAALLAQMQALPGVVEAAVDDDGRSLYLKVMQHDFDEAAAQAILNGGK